MKCLLLLFVLFFLVFFSACVQAVGVKAIVMDDDVFFDDVSVEGDVLIVNPDAGRDVTISLFDAVSGQKMRADVVRSAGADIDIDFIGTLSNGNYLLQASLEEPCQPCKLSKRFAVISRFIPPIPESDFFVLLLVPFAILAIILYSKEK